MTINTHKGEITATPEVLTYISLIAQYAADRLAERGLTGLSEESNKFSLEIYKALELSGCYDIL